MNAKVTWKGQMTFTGTADRGFTLSLDSAPASGGENSGFSPMELVLIGLAGCTAMDVIDILRKKRQDVTSFEVKVHAGRADEHPRVFNQVLLEYLITGHEVEKEAVERAVELSITKYCSVSAMFSKTAKLEQKITILEG
jgi:putative redox protein